MKKLKFFGMLMAAALLMGVGFTSCDDDDDDDGSNIYISVDQDKGIKDSYNVGDSIEVDYSVQLTDNKLEKIEIRKGTTTLDKFTETEFQNKISYIGSFGYKTTEATDNLEFAIYVTDNKGNTNFKTLTTKVVEATTDLGEASEITLTYTGKSGTGNVNEELGIEFTTVDAITAKFEVVSTKENKFVMFSETDAKAITTQEALKKAYDEGDKVESFTAQSNTKFEAKWFATKVGDVYYWVNLKSLNFEAGNNVAKFDYKK
jgi:hypothetical protein